MKRRSQIILFTNKATASAVVIALPSPGICAHLPDSVLSLPAKLFLSLCGIGVAGCDVARAAWFDHIWDLDAGSSLEVLYDIQNAVAFSGSQVVDAKAGFVLNFFEGFYMAFCQVYHMDIVSHAGSVRSVIVISEYAKLFQLADSYLSDIWHQVVRDSVWILNDGNAVMRTNRVKVTQKHNIP